MQKAIPRNPRNPCNPCRYYNRKWRKAVKIRNRNYLRLRPKG